MSAFRTSERSLPLENGIVPATHPCHLDLALPPLFIHPLFHHNQRIDATMTDTLETSAHQAIVTGKKDRDVLLDQLDELLERYLHTLHEYQRVMKELSQQLSEVAYYHSREEER